MPFTVFGSRFPVRVQVPVLCSLFALFAVPRSFAEVTRFEVLSRAEAGFGDYERITGRVFFAVDPVDPKNALIVDLGSAAALVHTTADGLRDLVPPDNVRVFHNAVMVKTAAEALVRDRYMLPDDVDPVVRRAGAHWDLFTRPTTTFSR